MGGFTSVLLERLKPLIFRTTRFQTDFELPVQVLEKHLEEREAELRQAGRQELFVVRSPHCRFVWRVTLRYPD